MNPYSSRYVPHGQRVIRRPLIRPSRAVRRLHSLRVPLSLIALAVLVALWFVVGYLDSEF